MLIKVSKCPSFAPVLGKLFKMSETTVITPPPNVEEKKAEKMTDDRIVKNVPRTYQVRANKLIGHLKEYTSVSWNANVKWSSMEQLYQALRSQSS